MLMGVPVAAGIVITTTGVMVFLLLQHLGHRALESFFAALVGVISVCFMAELHYVAPELDGAEVAKGAFAVGWLKSPTEKSAYIAVSMLGALVMPHNLFLHSALVLDRGPSDKRKATKATHAKHPTGTNGANGNGIHGANGFAGSDDEDVEDRELLARGGSRSDAAASASAPPASHSSHSSHSHAASGLGAPSSTPSPKRRCLWPKAEAELVILYSGLESGMALLFSLFINVAVVLVAAATAESLTGEERDELIENPLQSAPSMLRNVLGAKAETFFGFALLASGLSSTMTGTLAGQYVMEGFVELRMRPWLRAMLTRATAIVPSLLVTLIAGESGSEQLIVLCSVILSFELPFALIPLVRFVCDIKLMGDMAIVGTQKTLAVGISFVVILANMIMLASMVWASEGVWLKLLGPIGGIAYVAVLYRMATG